MATELKETCGILRRAMLELVPPLVVQRDVAAEFSLVTARPSPFKQHRGQPMWFGGVKAGKTYVSYHLMPIYMAPPLQAAVPPALKRRMQGKSCFQFTVSPDAATLTALRDLTGAALQAWVTEGWA